MSGSANGAWCYCLHHMVFEHHLESVRYCLNMLEGETSNIEEKENIMKIRLIWYSTPEFYVDAEGLERNV